MAAALAKIEAVLIDLSGTIHIENSVIPGAVEALEKLRDRNIKVRFVTNTTKESKRFLWERLTSLGFSVRKEDIFSSLVSAREIVNRERIRPLLLLEDAAMEDFEGVETSDPNAVVIGLAPSKFDYANLNEAFKLVLGGAELIAIHKSRYFKTGGGLALGPGPFVAGLEYSTDRKARVVGKPESTFFLEGLKPLGCQAANTVMIGDDVRDDIGGAQNAGMHGILVKTGKYREGDELKIDPPPHFIVQDFPEAVDIVLRNS